MDIRRIKRSNNGQNNEPVNNVPEEDNMYGEFEKKTVNNNNFGNNNNNNNINNNSSNNNNFNPNSIASFSDANGYHEKEYKTGSLEENTVLSGASKISKVFLYGFYLLFIVIGVMVFFMLRANKYEFYLKNDEVNVFKGSTYQVELIPKDARYFDYLNYKYTIGDKNIATVDEFGTVTAVGVGTTTLKISLSPGFTSKTMKIHSENIEISSIDLRVFADEKLKPSGPITLKVDESVSLRAIVNDREDLNTTVTYTSSDPSIVTVDDFGNVTGKSAGTAVITGTREDISGSITVTVTKDGGGSIVTPTSKPTPTGIQKIEFESSSMSLKKGTSFKLVAIITPRSLASSSLTWSSSNSSVATVDSSGSVKGVGNGTAVITAKSSNGKTASCTITVTEEDIKVSSITLNTKNATINIRGTYQLTAKISPNNATNRSLTWSSNNTAVATVNSNGLVTGVSAGTAAITVKTSDGSVSATSTIVVNNATPKPTNTPKPNTPTPKPGQPGKVTKITLSTTQTTQYVNDKLQLSINKVEPSSVTSYTVNWSSSNNGVASVNSKGLVTAKKAGTAVITATVDGVKASCTILVKNRTSPTPTPKPNTPTPTTGPTSAPTAAPEFTFNKNYVKVSTQSVSVSKGGTATFKVYLYNAAGLFDVKSSNTGIATVSPATAWRDGASASTGAPFWDGDNADQVITVTGVAAGNTTIVLTADEAGIATYDTSVELTGKVVINVTVK